MKTLNLPIVVMKDDEAKNGFKHKTVSLNEMGFNLIVCMFVFN